MLRLATDACASAAPTRSRSAFEAPSPRATSRAPTTRSAALWAPSTAATWTASEASRSDSAVNREPAPTACGATLNGREEQAVNRPSRVRRISWSVTWNTRRVWVLIRAWTGPVGSCSLVAGLGEDGGGFAPPGLVGESLVGEVPAVS